MRYTKLFIGLLSAILSAAAPLRAAFNDSGWGARPAAMGGAYAAVADDADAVLWNPAGAAQQDRLSFNFMYADPFAGLEGVSLGMNSLSFLQPTGYGAFGAAWANTTASHLYREDTFLLSYARRFLSFDPPNGSVTVDGGLNLKYLRNSFTLDSRTSADPVFSGGSDQDAYSADAGLLVRWNALSFGAAVKNLNTPDMGFRTTDRVPADVRTGLALRRKIFFFDDSTVALDYASRAGDGSLHLGWENWFFDRKAAFRAGWNDREFAMGLGYRQAMPGRWDFELNYAYILPLQLADNATRTHRISLGLRMGGGNGEEALSAPAPKTPKAPKVKKRRKEDEERDRILGNRR